MLEITEWFCVWQKGSSAPFYSCGAEASFLVGLWGACAHAFEDQGFIHACVFDLWGDNAIKTCWWKRQKDVAAVEWEQFI